MKMKRNIPNRRVWQRFSEAGDIERTAMELMQCATSCDWKIYSNEFSDTKLNKIKSKKTKTKVDKKKCVNILIFKI